MNASARRGACPALSAPMQTGDGLLVRLNPETGGLSPKSLIGLCKAALTHGNGIMEVTARGSLQIRGLTAASALDLAADVNTLAIPVRVGVPVEVGPLAGLDPDEVADPRPLAQAIRAAIANAGLSPRLGPKVSVVIDGGGRVAMDEIIADVRLVAVKVNGEKRWHCAIGGTSETARPLGVFSEADALVAVLKVLEAVVRSGLEGRARDLDSPTVGALANNDSTLPVIAGHAAESGRPGPGIFSLRDAGHALAVALPYGSMPAQMLAELARQAAIFGATEIRPAPRRTLLFLGADSGSCVRLQQVAAELGFVTDATDPRIRIAACPGAPACASGMIDTRRIAEEVALTAPDLFDPSLTLHISGCAKGCAHPTAAALTLVGGEKGAGLVVDGTAKALPVGYTPRYDAAHGIGRIAAAMRAVRHADEIAAACLARLGAAEIAKAYRQE